MTPQADRIRAVRMSWTARLSVSYGCHSRMRQAAWSIQRLAECGEDVVGPGSAIGMRSSGGQQRRAFVAIHWATPRASFGWQPRRSLETRRRPGWLARSTGAGGGSFRWASLDLGVDLGGGGAEWLHFRTVQTDP